MKETGDIIYNMIKNFVYVELGPELVCHDKLYQNAIKKQERVKE